MNAENNLIPDYMMNCDDAQIAQNDIQKIKEVFLKIDFLKNQICDSDIDNLEEVLKEIPDFLNWAYSKLGRALKILLEPEIKITNAKYGAKGNWIDVKNILEANMSEDYLELQINNTIMKKDPCPGNLKTLKVEYLLDNQQHIVVLNEGMKLVLDNKTI
jgi:hypothetical protein